MKNSNISQKEYAHLQNELKEISWAWSQTAKKVEMQNIIIHDQHTRLLNLQDKTAELRDRGDSLLEEFNQANAQNIQLIKDKERLFAQLQAQLTINDELRDTYNEAKKTLLANGLIKIMRIPNKRA